MLFSNIDFTIVYVDPSIATAGNGSTPSQALKDLPEAASLADKTCYLIRRTAETVACNLPSGTNSNLQHLLFMGMPLPTDTAYALVPDEAKTSWAADTAERANIVTANSSATLNMASLRTFLFHRIYLQRTCNSTNQYLIQSYQTNEFKGMFALEHCKMGVQGVNAEKSDWTGPAYENTAMLRYFYFGYVRYLRIKDCVINYKPYNSDYPAIYCSYPDILDLEDTQVNLLPTDNSRSNYALNLRGSSDPQGTEAIVSNLTFRYVFNGTNCRYFPGGLSCGYHLSTRISTVTATSVIPSGMAIPTDYCYPYQSLMYVTNLQDFSIKNITVNLPHFWRHNYHLLHFYGSGYSYSPGIEREISNISVTLGTDETVGIGGSLSYDEYKSTDNAYYALYASFDGSNSSYYQKACKMDNVTVTFARGRAGYLNFCRLTNSSFQGMVTLYRSMADITNLSTWFPGYAMRLYNYSHAHITKLTVNKTNESYAYNYDTAVERDRGNCNCFIEESNVIPEQINLSSSGVGQHYAMACGSEGETGHYTFRTQNIAVDTWNVRRTGGASAALKLWNDKWNNQGMIVLGRKPFKGKLLTAATPGRYILKVHVAYKNYTNENEMNRRFFITATVDEGTGNKTYCSSVCGRWVDDSTAVWENDSDLTQKCLELPLDIAEAGNVDVRLYFSWYSADGFLYVDPSMTLEMQETSSATEE